MSKTKRDLILTLSAKIGGQRGKALRTALETPFMKDLKTWDAALSEEEFQVQLKILERNVSKASLIKKKGKPENPSSWGLQN
jgi:hypothetical protein